MAKVLIPTPLRQYSEKHDSVELTGTTVGEVLGALTTKFPDLRKQLFNDEGKLRSFVNVYLNDEDIRYLKKDATPVAASPAYALPFAVTSAKTAARLAATLEDGVTRAYLGLVAVSNPTLRAFAAKAMQASANRALAWSGTTVAFPGMPN